MVNEEDLREIARSQRCLPLYCYIQREIFAHRSYQKYSKWYFATQLDLDDAIGQTQNATGLDA
jgi:hypothetical protein